MEKFLTVEDSLQLAAGSFNKWLTTWWSLWIIFFLYTSFMAIIVQLVLPQVFPNIYLTKGLFVPDSTGFHQIAAQKAIEIAEKGWGAWELRPQRHYPVGITSIFYYLWVPEPYSMIPYNAVLHATAGCLVFFLLTSFIKNRLVAACGATLFIINPASLEWTAQIHRDGTYILGNLLILTAWLLLIKGVMQKKWQNFPYAFILTLSGSFLIWATRPYWNHVALLSSILSFALILFYWVFNFRKLSFSLRWLTAAVVTGCIMLLFQRPFLDATIMPTSIKSQESIKMQKWEANSLTSLALIEIEKEITSVTKAMAKAEDTTKVMSVTKAKFTLQSIAARIEKTHNDLTKWQTKQDASYNNLRRFMLESDLIGIKKEVNKREVPAENYAQLSLAGLEERLQLLFQWDRELKKKHVMLQQKKKSRFEWIRTPYLPAFIENKLYGAMGYRNGSVSSGGNTVIDRHISLNSAGAFIRYFPRALQIGFLSPFPSEWFRTGSTPATTIGKRVIGGGMILFYICLPFFIWGLWEYRKSLESWIITLNSTLGIIVFTYVYPNIGTLSRLRYGFYMVIIAMGFAFAVQKLIELGQKTTIPILEKQI